MSDRSDAGDLPEVPEIAGRVGDDPPARALAPRAMWRYAWPQPGRRLPGSA
jgi:hypothetical protein